MSDVVDFDLRKIEYLYTTRCFTQRNLRGGLIKLSRKPKSCADDYACIRFDSKMKKDVKYTLDVSFKVKTKSHHMDFFLLTQDRQVIHKIGEYSIKKEDKNSFAHFKTDFVPDIDGYSLIGICGGLLYGPLNFIIISAISVKETISETEMLRQKLDAVNANIDRLRRLVEGVRNDVNINYQRELFIHWNESRMNGETTVDAKKRFFSSLHTEDEKMRVMQRAASVLLREFDRVCRKHEIAYWLDFGTLLGAVRHKGFIPWDDDIDVGMLRKDIAHLAEAVKGEETFIKVTQHYCADKFTNNVVRIRYLDDDVKVFVDIFIHDLVETDDMQTKWEQVKKYRRLFSDEMLKFKHVDNTPGLNREERLRIHDPQHKRIITERRDEYNEILGVNDSSGNAVFWGIDNFDCFAAKNGGIQTFDRIFPLSQVEFDGTVYCAPNMVQERLTEIYGDIYSLPRDMVGHTHVARTDKQYLKCLETLEKYDNAPSR